MRRSVAGIAVESMRAFIARRVRGGSMSEKWEFPGGKVEEGESDETALVREYLEEFAVTVQVGVKLADAVFQHREELITLTAYEVFFDSRDFVLSEHTEWKWATLSEIEKLDFADSDLKLLPSLRSRSVIAE
ncbi:MAG: NUDIX domain-containing protein [Treponemataceae bacterium]